MWTDEDFYEDELVGFGNDSVDLPGGAEHARGGRRWVHRPTRLSFTGGLVGGVRYAL